MSVKTLCAFSAKRGDLDTRFTPAPSANQGIAGHLLVQSRRGPDYAGEVSLSSTFGDLAVRGRADGYDAAAGRVEEIKTFKGRFDAIRANHRALHWAQARTYGWMLCERDRLPGLTVALVYLDIASGEETVLDMHCTADELRAEFESLCVAFTAWARQECAHRAALGDALTGLAFPYSDFRSGQRALAEGVFRAMAAGRCLIAQAPTGIGKTVATLFPVLKGWRAQATDKLFFLTAKTPGRKVAMEGLATARATPLRVIEIIAREKVCPQPGRACNGDDCPLARGFYDRLPAARQDAVEARWLDVACTQAVAARHQICPYFLAQEMVRWSDAVVADYNYYFDSSAYLFGLAVSESWRVAVLVDEAHNLLDRARSMYSARLDTLALEAAHRAAPAPIQNVLGRLLQQWRTLQDAQARRYEIQKAVPPTLVEALQAVMVTLGDHFAEEPAASTGPLQDFFFDVAQFLRLADSFGQHSVFESDAACADHGVAIRNLVPEPFLRHRFAASMATVCFSGTLTPTNFYRDVLGLPLDSTVLEVASPFDGQQLRVRAATDLSTRYADREHSLERLTDIIAAQFQRQPGNYLAFFGSYEYLAQARDRLAHQHPRIPAWAQVPAMDEAARDAFLERFRAGGQGIGYAVLGGAFGEGVDLPGDRLIGAFIASLGLPRHDDMNEALRACMQERFGSGYAYAYLYPGLRKVVQAAGRVIRSASDVGVLYLLDDRFGRAQTRALLPPWWDIEKMPAAMLQEAPGAQSPSSVS